MTRFGLGARFIATTLGIVLSVHFATSWSVLTRTRHNQETHAQEMLAAGGRIFARLLQDRERQLLESVEVLASDFGLKRAVATRDRATIDSALANHGRRIDADLTLATDLEGHVVGRTSKGASLDERGSALQDLLHRARTEGSASDVLIDDRGHPLQTVIAPVKAPLPIGWIIMGFELDGKLAHELRELTDLEVAFWARIDPSQPPFVTSTHNREDAERFARELMRSKDAPRPGEPFAADDARWISLAVPVDRHQRAATGAVLRTSYAAAMQPYAALRDDLVAVFALGVALALAGALATSRRLTRPIGALVEATQAIAAGRFDLQLEVKGRDEIGDLARTFGLMQEAVADRERTIVHRSTHDGLTGLPNRSTVVAHIASALDASATCWIVVLDVDGLKDINDTLGTTIGDEILKEIAGRLTRHPRIDFVARIGGDEFMLILDPDVGASEEHPLADLLTACSAPHLVRGARVVAQLSAGLAVGGEDGNDAETLLRRAEMALSIAKEERAPFARYRDGVEETRHRHVGILIELERAIENDELELHYQPKIDIRERRVYGAEALVRWSHPTMGRMNPEEFVGLAEQAGSIEKLSQWVLKTALEQESTWATQGVELELSINLSAHDVIQGQLPQQIAGLLSRWPIGDSGLQLEVTESAVITDPERAAEQLAAIRKMGVRVAIDDFGTGHASLAQLKNLPVDEIKIDQTFVRNLRENTIEDVIVRTTIELGHQLGMRVIAEGVEDRISWDILRRHGCDAVQGYWFSRPLPPKQFTEYLDRFEKVGIDD